MNLKEILSKAKRKFASGGTIRDNEIELQGDHKFKMKQFLADLGFSQANIVFQDQQG